MSNANKSDKSVAVISDAQQEELSNYMRSLHGKMLTILQGVGIAPTFNDKFTSCTNEDYKNLHQQTRALLTTKEKAKWDTYIGGISAQIADIVSTYMSEARKRKARYDAIEDREFLAPFPTTFKVPMSELLACWPQGTEETRIIAEMDKLFPKNVGKDATGKWNLTVTFKPAEVVEEAPKSDTQAVAA